MKLTKIMVLALALCLLLSLSACASGSKSAPSKDAYTLLNKGVLTIGMEVGYPPFEEFASDGKTPVGYDVDLANALGKKLGVKINIINTSFDGIFAGIGTNYDVVISGVTITEERKKTMLFSTPYVSNYQAVVAKAGSSLSIKSLNDLNDHTVSIQKGTTSDTLLSDLISTDTIKATVVSNESVIYCLELVSKGEVDVCLLDSTVANVYVAKNNNLKTIFVDEAEPEQFGIALGKDNVGLQEAINKAMAELKTEGFFTESDAIWFK